MDPVGSMDSVVDSVVDPAGSMGSVVVACMDSMT